MRQGGQRSRACCRCHQRRGHSPWRQQRRKCQSRRKRPAGSRLWSPRSRPQRRHQPTQLPGPSPPCPCRLVAAQKRGLGSPRRRHHHPLQTRLLRLHHWHKPPPWAGHWQPSAWQPPPKLRPQQRLPPPPPPQQRLPPHVYTGTTNRRQASPRRRQPPCSAGRSRPKRCQTTQTGTNWAPRPPREDTPAGPGPTPRAETQTPTAAAAA